MIRRDIEDEGGTYTKNALVVEVFTDTLFVKWVWRTGLHRLEELLDKSRACYSGGGS